MSEEELTDSLVDGEMIYWKLRSKYIEHTTENMNQIINSMCAGIYVLAKANIPPDQHWQVIKLVNEILTFNLNK